MKSKIQDAIKREKPEQTPADPITCPCSLRTRLVGDGCSICNPDYWDEMLKQHPEDGNDELEQPHAASQQDAILGHPSPPSALSTLVPAQTRQKGHLRPSNGPFPESHPSQNA